MQKKSFLFILVALCVIAGGATLFAGSHALATTMSSNTSVLVGADDVIDDDLYISGETVTISGTVNGDVFASAGTLDVDGTINGDLYAGAGTADISGTIRDDLVLGTGTAILNSATIGDSAIVGAGTFSTNSDTTIGGGLTLGAGTADISGNIGRGVTAGSGTTTINAEISKSVTLGVGSLTIQPSTIIAGDLTYESSKSADISDKAFIGGVTEHILPQTSSADVDLANVWARASLGYGIWSFIAALIVGLLLLYLLPKTSDRVVKQLRTEPGKAFVVGLIVLIIKPIVIVVLFMTLIGIPIAMILFAIYLIMLYIAKILFGYFIGTWIFEKAGQKNHSPYLAMVVGLLIFAVVSMIPIVGTLIAFLAMVLTYGGLLLQKREVFKRLEK